MGLPEYEIQTLTTQPRDGRLCRIESSRDEQGIMRPLLKAHHNIRFGDRHLSRGVDEVLKQVPRLGVFVTLADAASQQSIKAAGHQRQLQVTVDLHRHGRAQSIHVKEVDPVRDTVLDDHPLGVSLDQVGRFPCQLVGQQDRRLLVAQVGGGHLTQGAFRHRWGLLCYVVMGNHLHLLVKTPRPNLGAGMQSFLSGYAIWAALAALGHLFQGRYCAEMIEDLSNPPVAEARQLAGLDPKRIFAAVTPFYGLDDEALSRRYDPHVARAVAAWLCRRHTEASLQELAASLRLSRADSVPNLTRRIETRLKTSPELSNDLAEILKRASSPDAGDDRAIATLSMTPQQSPGSKADTAKQPGNSLPTWRLPLQFQG
jgi:hypothetical protein